VGILKKIKKYEINGSILSKYKKVIIRERAPRTWKKRAPESMD